MTEAIIPGERIGLVIEAVLRRSLIESIAREVCQRIELAAMFRRGMQSDSATDQRGAACEVLTDDLFEWYCATVQRYRLDAEENGAIQNAILSHAQHGAA